MFTEKELAKIEERRRLLILQAELHRSLIAFEGASIADAANQARRAAAGLKAALPWLAGGALVGGVLAAKNWRHLGRWAPVLVTAWRWWRRIQQPA